MPAARMRYKIAALCWRRRFSTPPRLRFYASKAIRRLRHAERYAMPPRLSAPLRVACFARAGGACAARERYFHDDFSHFRHY